jgi:predicted transposase YdaD
MKQSVIYQEIELQGVTKGKREEGLSLILRQLNRRIGLITPNLESKIRQLPLNLLEDLGEALLDFQTETDLINWLNHHV